jgi:two-component sensor histidine kinase
LLASVSEVNRIRLLLELGKQQLLPTSTQQSNGDSARIFFELAQKRSENIGNKHWQEESLALIGVTYILKQDWPRGRAYFGQVIEARQRARDKAGELRARLRMVSTAYCDKDDCQQYLKEIDQVLALAREVGDKAREAVTLLHLGFVYIWLGDIKQAESVKQAERLAQQALKIQKVIGYPVISRASHAVADESIYYPRSSYADLGHPYFLLAYISKHQKDLNQALSYYLTLTKDVERNGLIEELPYPYYELGRLYADLGQVAKSAEYYQKSLAVSHQKGEAIVLVSMARRMAQTMIAVGRAKEALQVLTAVVHQNLPMNYEQKISNILGLGECYSALKQYNQAEQYYQQAIAWSKQATTPSYILDAKYETGKFYVSTGQYAKAEPLIKSVLDFVANNKNASMAYHFRDAYLLRFKVDSALANYTAAIKHFQAYIAIKDSIFNETKSKQIEELGVRYETEKKEQILQLKEKNIALLKQQNKAGQTQRNALIGGSVLLLLLLGLSYNRYRLKRRSNQLLEAKQREINEKNDHLSQLLGEKDSLLVQKDTLIEEKDGLLTEKEWLLKEIHHRVKNNLQVVMSLLDSQADSLVDKAALSAIQESQHRVQAMALIHQKLYQSESLACIPMNSYIEEVVAYLHDSYSLYQPIRFEVEVEDIELDVTLAVPLGLIINEAITNAFKYAFPDERSGTISVHLKRVEEASYELMIADDGVGLPASYDPSRSRSLGMTLIHGFSRQLGAELAITSPPGMCISLVFQEENLTSIHTKANYAYSTN